MFYIVCSANIRDTPICRGQWKNLLVVQPRWDFVQDTLKDFFLYHFFTWDFQIFVAYLITPPSCFTFISPVFFDSNAAKAFLNLKMLSSGMKSAILTPSNGGIYKCEDFLVLKLV